MKRITRNWSEYNAGLKLRGSLTFWLDEAVLEAWYNLTPSGKRGATNDYSDVAIAIFVTLKSLYHQAGRQTQGLLESLFELMGIDLVVPDHSTVSRRMGKLEVALPVIPKDKALHVVVDSTGVKVYGEGEWKTRQHGISKRRTIALWAFKKGGSCIWVWTKRRGKLWQRSSRPTMSMTGKS